MACQCFHAEPPEGRERILATASLAVGRFGNTTHDQLAVVYAVPRGTAKIVTIDFDSDGNAIQKAVFDTGVATSDTPFAVIRAGHFDWSGSFDQAAVLVQPAQKSSSSRIQLFGFDTSLNPAAGPAFPLTAGFCCRTSPPAISIGCRRTRIRRRRTNATPTCSSRCSRRIARRASAFRS